MTVSEQLRDDFIAHGIDLRRFESALERDILKLLAELRNEVSAELVRLNPLDAVRRTTREKRLRALLKQVDETIKASYSQMNALSRRELTELGKLESQFVQKSLTRRLVPVIPVEISPLSASLLQSLVSDVLIEGAPNSVWWGRQSADLRRRFADQMRMGMASGDTIDQMVRRIRGKSLGRGRYEGGIFSGAETQVRRHVRTSAIATWSDARRKTFEENRSLIRGVVQVSTLDDRISKICTAYAGKAFEYDKDGVLRPSGHSLPYLTGVPRHYQCRSVEVPWLKSLRSMGLKQSDIKAGTRASIGGEVPSDITMRSWIDGLSVTRQNRVLGTYRATEFRAGRLRLEQLVDTRGETRTVEELRKLLAA